MGDLPYLQDIVSDIQTIISNDSIDDYYGIRVVRNTMIYRFSQWKMVERGTLCYIFNQNNRMSKCNRYDKVHSLILRKTFDHEGQCIQCKTHRSVYPSKSNSMFRFIILPSVKYITL